MIEWIQTSLGLSQLLKRLQSLELYPSIALDTEFLRRSTFFAKPCLLQLAWQPINEDQPQVALIDLVQCHHKHLKHFIAGLYDMCSNTDITLAMHAPSEDLQLLSQLGTEQAAPNLLDTQVAATYLGHRSQISLFDLAEGMLQMRPSKSHAQSDWSQRPLSWLQLSYAAMDVILTLRLCKALRPLLINKGSWEQALADTQCIYQTIPLRESSTNYCERQSQIAKIQPSFRPRLAHLLEWRETSIRFMDIPRKWHLSNDALMAISTMGDEGEPPKLQAILHKLYGSAQKQKRLGLQDKSKSFFLQTLDLDELHDGFYGAWKALPPYANNKVPVRLNKKAKQSLASLEQLAEEHVERYNHPRQAFMRRSWLKGFMHYFAQKKLGQNPSPPCFTLGWRAPFFLQAHEALESDWPFHVPVRHS